MGPMIVRYLGSLPTSEVRETAGDDGLTRNTGRHEEVVRAGIEPKARVKMTWHGPFESTWLNRNRQTAVVDILRVRLREVMREDMGGVYGVSVSASSWERPTEGYRATISFSCDPERLDELVAAALEGVAGMVAEPVTDEEIAVAQEKNRRGREEQIKSNGFWVSSIIGTLDRGEDPLELLAYNERNESLNAAEVHAMAQKLFSEDAHFVKVVLLPEETGAPEAEAPSDAE